MKEWTYLVLYPLSLGLRDDFLHQVAFLLVFLKHILAVVCHLAVVTFERPIEALYVRVTIAERRSWLGRLAPDGRTYLSLV